MRFSVIYEREEGWWTASIPTVPGCHTQGRTLAQAKERIREALAVALEGPKAEQIAAAAELIDEVKLPATARRAVTRAAGDRQAAEKRTAQALASISVAARTLTESYGMSLRDAGAILGLSYERVRELAAPPAASKRTAKRRRAA